MKFPAALNRLAATSGCLMLWMCQSLMAVMTSPTLRDLQAGLSVATSFTASINFSSWSFTRVPHAALLRWGPGWSTGEWRPTPDGARTSGEREPSRSGLRVSSDWADRVRAGTSPALDSKQVAGCQPGNTRAALLDHYRTDQIQQAISSVSRASGEIGNIQTCRGDAGRVLMIDSHSSANKMFFPVLGQAFILTKLLFESLFTFTEIFK